MTNRVDTPVAAGEAAPRHRGRLVAITILRVVGVLAVVAGGYVLVTIHADKVAARSADQAEIRKDRIAVIARAEGHTVYAPARWGVAAYPTASTHGGVMSWGTYGAVHLYLWQVPDRAIASHPRHMRSLATPESLCAFTDRDRKTDELLAEQTRTMRCSLIPGTHAQIRLLRDSPQPGMTDVRLAMALPEKGRYLNLWAIDETGAIAKDPVAWATGFIRDLAPYDVTGYSVEDTTQARDTDDWDVR